MQNMWTKIEYHGAADAEKLVGLKHLECFGYDLKPQTLMQGEAGVPV